MKMTGYCVEYNEFCDDGAFQNKHLCCARPKEYIYFFCSLGQFSACTQHWSYSRQCVIWYVGGPAKQSANTNIRICLYESIYGYGSPQNRNLFNLCSCGKTQHNFWRVIKTHKGWCQKFPAIFRMFTQSNCYTSSNFNMKIETKFCPLAPKVVCRVLSGCYQPAVIIRMWFYKFNTN